MTVFVLAPQEETPLFLAAREGSYETAKVLLEHFANREITDHMDRLPRDIAQERMHHDIVRLLDEYNLVRSPPVHSAPLATSLSPPLCSPNGYLNSMKPAVQNKKTRKPGSGSAKGVACKEGGKDMKNKKKKPQEGGRGSGGGLLDTSAVLSPVDSLESPHGYISDVSSPPLMTSPFQHSPTSMALGHLQALPPEAHLASVNHLGMANKQFDPLPPRLTHLPMATTGNGQCDWMSRLHSSMGQQAQQFNTLGGNRGQQGGMGHQGNGPVSHGLMHNGLAPSTLSQMMGFPGMPNSHLGNQTHLMQGQPMQQNLQNLQQQLQGQQNSNPPSSVSPGFISGDLGGPDVIQQGTGGNGGNGSLPIHTILPQETQIMSAQLGPGLASTQFLTPPSQHSYSATMEGNTPNHQLQVPDHPFLTPSPGSPDQWSSSSPHSNMSDWSEGISSPPTSMQSQIGHIPNDHFK